MLNHITLMGRLTRDPELRYTQSNTPVASFSLAVERDFGSREDRQTDFIDCVAWRHTGEFINTYFRKGSLAIISGRLQIRDWTDQHDNKRRSAEVVVENIYFGEKKQSAAAASEGVSGYDGQVSLPDYYRGTTAAFSEIGDEDGELPF